MRLLWAQSNKLHIRKKLVNGACLQSVLIVLQIPKMSIEGPSVQIIGIQEHSRDSASEMHSLKTNWPIDNTGTIFQKDLKSNMNLIFFCCRKIAEVRNN